MYTDHTATATYLAVELGLGVDEIARLCADLEAAGHLKHHCIDRRRPPLPPRGADGLAVTASR